MYGGAGSSSQPSRTEDDVQYLIALCDSTLVDLQIVHVKSGQQHQLAEQQIQTIKQLRQQILRNQGATPETLSALNATASSLAHVVYVAAPASPYTQHSPVFRTSILSL